MRSRDGQISDYQTGNVARTVSSIYGGLHGGGRFLDSVETLHRVSKSAEVGL